MEKSEDETNTDNNAYNSIGDDTIDENIYAPKSSCKGIENWTQKNSPLPCSKTDFTRIIRRKGMYLNKCCIDAFHILYQISGYHWGFYSLLASRHNCFELRVGAEDGTPASLLLLVSISTFTSSSTSCCSSPSSLLCVHVEHMVLWLMLWEKTVKYCSKRIYPPGWRNCGAAAVWSLWCSLAKNSQVEVFQGCCLPFWRKFYF